MSGHYVNSVSLFFKFPTKEKLIPAASWFKASVCVARFLGLRVPIPPGELISVCCECCLLSFGGLCDGLITGPESPTECDVSS